MQVFEYVIVRESKEGSPTQEEPTLLDGKVHVCLAENSTQVAHRFAQRALEESNEMPADGEEIRILVRPFKLLGFDESYCHFIKSSGKHFDRGFLDGGGDRWLCS